MVRANAARRPVGHAIYAGSRVSVDVGNREPQGNIRVAAVWRPWFTSRANRAREEPATTHVIRKHGIEVVGLKRIVPRSRSGIGDHDRKVLCQLPLDVEVILHDVVALGVWLDVLPPFWVTQAGD